MRKIRTIAMALFVIIALGACTEVPIRVVEKCAKVADIKAYKYYFVGIIPQVSLVSYSDIWAYKVLDNGKHVRIEPVDYFMWGSSNWFTSAKNMEIGRNYCWTEYEKIK